MLRYALYARKSSERREETEKSIDEQTAECQMLAARSDLTVAAVYGESKSAKKPGVRPLYAQMIQQIEKGEVNAILCWKVNRLIRNMEEGGKLVQLLVDGTIQEIRTPFQVFRPRDNILPLVLDAASSTQYSIDLVDTVTRGLKGHFDLGGWNSKAYVGYVNARHPVNHKVGVVLPDGERFTLLRKGWEMLLTGAYTPAQVARTLNDVWGFRTRRTVKRGGTPLSRSHAYSLFRNPFYAGYVRYRGELKRGTHEPMVAEVEFAQVQAILDAQGIAERISKNGAATQRSQKRSFPFTGLLQCGYCGCQITAEYHTLRNGNPYTFYRCSNAKGNCDQKGISGIYLEKEVLRLLESVSIPAELCDAAREDILAYLETDSDSHQAIYSQQQSTLADVERQLSNLVSMWLRGLLTDEVRYRSMEAELNAKKNNLLLETAKLRQELETMRGNAVAACHYLKFAQGCFQVSDAVKKREIAHALCLGYKLYGKEKRLEAEVHPLLREVVRFARDINHFAPAPGFFPGSMPTPVSSPQPSPASNGGIKIHPRINVRKVTFEPGRIGSRSGKITNSRVPVLSGRSERSTVEPTLPLINLLRSSEFPHLQLG
jgi:site-specific DNA recombinase